MTTLQWTHWSLLQEVTIVADNGQVAASQSGLSQLLARLGRRELQACLDEASDAASRHRISSESPITDPGRSPRLPDSGALPISIGVTYDIVLGVFSVGTAYLHEFAVGSTATRDFSATPSAGVLIGKYASNVNVFSVGTKLRF